MNTTTLVLVACLALAGGPGPAPADSLRFPLRWMLNVHGDHPTTLPSIGSGASLAALRVAKVEDSRDKGRRIGENSEDRDGVVPIYTDSNIGAFLRDAVVAQLENAGLDILPDKADRVLTLDLIEFWATESRGYRASVRARARLTDARGRELWSGVVRGIGENWGRSLNEDNYNETFSNAIFDMVVSLLNQDGFRNGVRKK